MNFQTHSLSHSALQIGYKDEYKQETMNKKFLYLPIDNHINWKNHFEQMIPKLNAACYAFRSTVHISNSNTVKSIYCSYFCTVIYCGIIVGGNCSNSGMIFTLQQTIFRIMVCAQHRISCKVHLNN
jgi:hypothetical protein